MELIAYQSKFHVKVRFKDTGTEFWTDVFNFANAKLRDSRMNPQKYRNERIAHGEFQILPSEACFYVWLAFYFREDSFEYYSYDLYFDFTQSSASYEMPLYRMTELMAALYRAGYLAYNEELIPTTYRYKREYGSTVVRASKRIAHITLTNKFWSLVNCILDDENFYKRYVHDFYLSLYRRRETVECGSAALDSGDRLYGKQSIFVVPDRRKSRAKKHAS